MRVGRATPSPAAPTPIAASSTLIDAGGATGAESWWRRHLTEANHYLLAIPGGDEPLDLLD